MAPEPLAATDCCGTAELPRAPSCALPGTRGPNPAGGPPGAPPDDRRERQRSLDLAERERTRSRSRPERSACVCLAGCDATTTLACGEREAETSAVSRPRDAGGDRLAPLTC